MSFCSRCGKNIPTNAKYCMHCSTTTSAPLPSKPITTSEPKKESHIKRNILIVVTLILVIGAFTAASSPSEDEKSTENTSSTFEATPQTTPTSPEIPQATRLPLLELDRRVHVGESYIIEGAEEIPVIITFNSVYYTGKKDWHRADEGYKFLVLDMQLKNVGMEETKCLPHYGYDWEVTVDKGYIYDDEAVTIEYLSLRPEDVKTGYVIFEILKTTNPLEINCNYYDGDIIFTMDLRNQQITTKTANE